MFKHKFSNLLFGGFLVLGLFSFSLSIAGSGVTALKDPNIARDIKKNCPDYYQNRNGDCLKKTFRSYYFLHRTRGSGSRGSGK